jgi:nitroreductase
MRNLARMIGTRLRARLLGIVSKSEWLSVVTLVLMNRGFRQEAHRTLVGIHPNSRIEGREFQLRRSIHRLEKGLMMHPRRSGFASDYIEETVETYARDVRGLKGEGSWPTELLWAHDVLEAFFEAVSGSGKVENVRSVFSGIKKPERVRSEPMVPGRPDPGPVPVSYDALLHLALRRRSVRWYQPQPVPRELIDRAIDVARRAPSGCNRQPFRIMVVDDPVAVRRVVGLALGSKGWAEDAPGVAVFVGDWGAFRLPRDRHLPFVDGGLAAMGFAFAAATLGLGTCPIHWPDIPSRSKAAATLLGLHSSEQPLFMMAYGYPDPERLVACSAKTDLHLLRTHLDIP